MKKKAPSSDRLRRRRSSTFAVLAQRRADLAGERAAAAEAAKAATEAAAKGTSPATAEAAAATKAAGHALRARRISSAEHDHLAKMASAFAASEAEVRAQGRRLSVKAEAAKTEAKARGQVKPTELAPWERAAVAAAAKASPPSRRRASLPARAQSPKSPPKPPKPTPKPSPPDPPADAAPLLGPAGVRAAALLLEELQSLFHFDGAHYGLSERALVRDRRGP